MSTLPANDAKFVRSLQSLTAPVLTGIVLVGYIIFSWWNQWDDITASRVLTMHYFILSFCLFIMILAWLVALFSARSVVRALRGVGLEE